MKNIIFVIISGILSPVVFGQTVSLGHGNSILTMPIEGHLSIYCPDESNGTRLYFNCYSDDLDGGNYGRVVVSDGEIDADWVKLQREGSKYIKGSSFDPEKQESPFNFNLWVGSLFQRPLLKMGKNKINYTFLKNKKVVKQGYFELEVTEGELLSCPNDSRMYPGFCPSMISACDDYFARYNYCQ